MRSEYAAESLNNKISALFRVGIFFM